MALPHTDRTNPRDLARSTSTSATFHDVVIGASKVIHHRDLAPSDIVALQWAKAVIESASDRDVMYAMPSSTQLEGTNEAVIAIRRAVQDPKGDDANSALDNIRSGIDAALQGDRGAPTAETMSRLRSLFALVSEIALRSEVTAYGTTAWQTTPKILPS